MAKTIFAREQIEEFSFQQRLAIFTPSAAIIPWFSEYFLVRNRP